MKITAFRDAAQTNIDKLVKSPKFRHAPAFAGAGSAKAGIQNYLKTLDSRLRGNDAEGRFKTFYETINLPKYHYFIIPSGLPREWPQNAL